MISGQRLLHAIWENRYLRENLITISMSTPLKSKFKVAVLFDVSRAYDRDVLSGITNFNNVHNKFIFFFFPPKYLQGGNQATLVERVIGWEPDGILTREFDGFDVLLELDIPLILFPHTKPYQGKINVWGDNRGVGKMAAAYFIAKGYKHYGYLGFKDFQWSLERQAGYAEQVGKQGYKVSTFDFDRTNLFWEHLPARLMQWLATLSRPCAVFSATDELNVHLLDAARQAGLKVPDDLCLLGVDNDAMICDLAYPTLSSIDHHARQAGTDAAFALWKWMEAGERPPGDITSDAGKIVTRNSSNALAVEDDQVRSALHFIANTAPSEDISVEDVVRATALSRRNLEKRFQSLLRSSVMEEIKKVRVARIKFLLEHSDLTVQQIANELNFRSFDNITRYFRQATGVNPKDYRNRFR